MLANISPRCSIFAALRVLPHSASIAPSRDPAGVPRRVSGSGDRYALRRFERERVFRRGNARDGQANDDASRWPRVSRARMRRVDPALYETLDALFEERRAATEPPGVPCARLDPGRRRYFARLPMGYRRLTYRTSLRLAGRVLLAH